MIPFRMTDRDSEKPLKTPTMMSIVDERSRIFLAVRMIREYFFTHPYWSPSKNQDRAALLRNNLNRMGLIQAIEEDESARQQLYQPQDYPEYQKGPICIADAIAAFWKSNDRRRKEDQGNFINRGDHSVNLLDIIERFPNHSFVLNRFIFHTGVIYSRVQQTTEEIAMELPESKDVASETTEEIAMELPESKHVAPSSIITESDITFRNRILETIAAVRQRISDQVNRFLSDRRSSGQKAA